MDLRTKLQIKPGQRVRAVGAPPEVDLAALLDAPGATDAADAARADVVIAFVRSGAELSTTAAPALAAAKDDRTAWIAYPKGGGLGTDLNRDVLRAALAAHGIRPVRQIAIDEVWSALRFRPG
ncbi:MAG: hypothetical protein FWD74_03545 [Actinomycetia bacterium]|nr:hypothetical protein [Actinomycetes bacterium]